MYRYIPRESCSQFGSLPLTSLTEGARAAAREPSGIRTRTARLVGGAAAARRRSREARGSCYSRSRRSIRRLHRLRAKRAVERPSPVDDGAVGSRRSWKLRRRSGCALALRRRRRGGGARDAGDERASLRRVAEGSRRAARCRCVLVLFSLYFFFPRTSRCSFLSPFFVLTPPRRRCADRQCAVASGASGSVRRRPAFSLASRR